MKKILWTLIVTGLIPVSLFAQSKSESPINKTAQGVGFSQTLDMSGYSRFSAQAVYGDGTPTADTVSEGNFSSATLTVNNYDALDGRASSATFTLQSAKNGSVGGAVLTILDQPFTEGVDWSQGATSTVTWNSLLAAVTTYGKVSDYSASVSSNVLTILSRSSGTAANSWIIASSTLPAISTKAFTGGQPFGYVNINGTTLTEGTDWNAATSSGTTAINIRDAINANSTLNVITTATIQATGVVKVVSRNAGYNPYYISVSSQAALTPSFPQFVGGADSDVSVTGDAITQASHGFTTGLKVLLATVSGTAPTGLTTGTTYFAIRNNDSTYQLATTSTTAIAGTAIDITALTGGSSFTVTPLALSAGSAGFKWQGSNDGTNFTDFALTSVSSVTYSAAGSTLWDFGAYAYKYLKIVFTGPTSGGISLLVNIFGKE